MNIQLENKEEGVVVAKGSLQPGLQASALEGTPTTATRWYDAP
jgi:hypothetical protein